MTINAFSDGKKMNWKPCFAKSRQNVFRTSRILVYYEMLTHRVSYHNLFSLHKQTNNIQLSAHLKKKIVWKVFFHYF